VLYQLHELRLVSQWRRSWGISATDG